MRNWSYAYALDEGAPKVKDKLAVSPLPPFEGGGKGGVLGGNGPVISAFTDVPEASVVWLDYWTSEETLKRNAEKYSLPPTMPQLYEDPGVKETMPYAAQLLEAVERDLAAGLAGLLADLAGGLRERQQGGRRPAEPEDALKRGQEQIEQALDSF